MVEPRSNLTRIYEPSVAVETQEQGSEAYPAPSWIRVSADHELLFLPALDLEPIARPPGDVRAGPVFCDDPLPSVPAGLSKVSFSLSLAMFGEPQRTLEVEGSSKNFLPIPESDLPRVIAIQIQQIEEIEMHWNLAE